MKTFPHGRNSAWADFGRFLIIVLLAVAMLLLGQSMVHHRFHEGGRVHENGSVGQ
jgi:hypothetical protein